MAVASFDSDAFNRAALNNSDIAYIRQCERQKSAAGVRAMKNVLPHIFSSSLRLFTSQPDGVLRRNRMIVSGVLSFTFFSPAVILWVPSVLFLSFGTDDGATGPVANYALLALPPVRLFVLKQAHDCYVFAALVTRLLPSYYL